MKKITEPEILLDVYDDKGNKTKTFDISYHEIHSVVKLQTTKNDELGYILILKNGKIIAIDKTLYELVQDLIENEPPMSTWISSNETTD